MWTNSHKLPGRDLRNPSNGTAFSSLMATEESETAGVRNITQLGLVSMRTPTSLVQSMTRTCQEGLPVCRRSHIVLRSVSLTTSTRPAAQHHDDGFSLKKYDRKDNHKTSCAGGFGSLEDSTTFLNQRFTLVGSDMNCP
jgi:hypothetical protein